MTTLFACFDKYCYELQPVEPLREARLAGAHNSTCQSTRKVSLTPVRGTPSRQELDLTRADLRRRSLGPGHSHLHWASVRSVVCCPGRGRAREKNAWYLGRTTMRNTYSCSVLSSPLQRRSYRRPSTLTPVPAS